MISKVSRKAHSSPKAPRPAAPYEPAVSVGNIVAVSGQVGLTADRELAGPDVAAQTRQTLENVRACVDAAGGSVDDIIRCGVYLADLADFAAMNEVYGEFFAEPRPARTTIGAALAKGFLVEIDALAVLAGDGDAIAPRAR